MAEAWSRHAKTYDATFERSTWLWARDAFTFAGFVSPSPHPRKLLDVACGTGRLALTAAQLGFQVTATDHAEGMLQCVQEKAAAAGVEISTVVADGQTLGGVADATFDVVTSNFGIAIFPQRCDGWRAALRVLKPGGRLLATGWAAENATSAIGRYVMENAVKVEVSSETPAGNEKAQATSAPTPPPVNASSNAALFAQELTECGYTNVAIYPVEHDMCYTSGGEFVLAMLDNGAIAPLWSMLDNRSIKICVMHYLDLKSQGIDPFTDSSAPRAPTPDEVAAEDMAFWTKPVAIRGCAHIAIAEKPQ